MTSELEIVTPNLRGSCMTIGNQLHGLFKLTGQKRDPRRDAWLKVQAAQHNMPMFPQKSPVRD
ncbi:MAG: hypothetical protein WAM75_04220 [Xanthobacteraceae bacterium]